MVAIEGCGGDESGGVVVVGATTAYRAIGTVGADNSDGEGVGGEEGGIGGVVCHGYETWIGGVAVVPLDEMVAVVGFG